jgi:hypothetical protein
MFPNAGEPVAPNVPTMPAAQNLPPAKTALAPPPSHTAPMAAQIAHKLAEDPRDHLPESTIQAVLHATQPSLPTIDEDLPVLSDVVASDAARDPLIAGMDPAILNILVSELARNIGRHVAGELPNLLYNSTLATLEADLRRGILAATEVAARDFIAQRQRLSRASR